jgi:type IV secretory pathway VirB10-like protein
MNGIYSRSGVITPPLSEDGHSGRCHSAQNPCEVNKDSPLYINTPPSPPTPPTTRRRDRLSLQKEREANRSKQFTTRLQRSASGDKDASGRGKRSFQQRQRNSLGSEGSNGEAEDQKVLTKMAFAEQQKWITVQQKTFTKWCVRTMSDSSRTDWCTG